MIFNDLVVTTKALQELQRKTQIKNNKEQQENAEAKYRILLMQTNQLVAFSKRHRQGLPKNRYI